MPMFAILRKTPDYWRPLMGFMDQQGNIKIEPQFLQNAHGLGSHFSKAGYAVVQRPGAKQHIVINEEGETVFEFPKDHKPVSSTPPDEQGIFRVMHQVDAENQELWKLAGRDNIFLGETRYYAMRLDGSVAFEAYISQATNGFYLFSKSSKLNDKKGLMNHEGHVVIPPIYDAAYLSRTDPYVTVLKDGVANIFTLEGSSVFPRSFAVKDLTNLRHVNDGLWVVAHSGLAHADVFDVASTANIGRLPVTYWSPMIPRACPTLSGGVACINHACKGSTYLHPDGSAAMPGILRRPRWFKPAMRTGYFSDGRASFKLGEVWGYLNLAGQHAITPQFRSNLPFRDGLARVKYVEDGNSWDRYSYIDQEGAVVWHQED